MTTQDYAAFLESLKVNNDGQERILYYDLIPGVDRWKAGDEAFDGGQWYERTVKEYAGIVDGSLPGRRRANAKPLDLAEQVKAFMRAGMDAAIMIYANRDPADQRRLDATFEEFRRLSEAATEAKENGTTPKV
jgi:hypothetical protein